MGGNFSIKILASLSKAMPKVRECDFCCRPWNEGDPRLSCAANCPSRRGMHRREVRALISQGQFPEGLHPRCRLMQEARAGIATCRQGCMRELRKCADAIKGWAKELEHWGRENDRLQNQDRQLKAYEESTPAEEPIAPPLPPPPPPEGTGSSQPTAQPNLVVSPSPAEEPIAESRVPELED